MTTEIQPTIAAMKSRDTTRLCAQKLTILSRREGLVAAGVMGGATSHSPSPAAEILTPGPDMGRRSVLRCRFCTKSTILVRLMSMERTVKKKNVWRKKSVSSPITARRQKSRMDVSRIPRKKPRVRTVISEKRFLVMFQPSWDSPWAILTLTSRCWGEDTMDLVTTSMFSSPSAARKKGTR